MPAQISAFQSLIKAFQPVLGVCGLTRHGGTKNPSATWIGALVARVLCVVKLKHCGIVTPVLSSGQLRPRLTALRALIVFAHGDNCARIPRSVPGAVDKRLEKRMEALQRVKLDGFQMSSRSWRWKCTT
jgi:hypothetical protein